jgi:hypothetical protein
MTARGIFEGATMRLRRTPVHEDVGYPPLHQPWQ